MSEKVTISINKNVADELKIMLKAATLQEAVMKAVEFTYVNGNRLANAESARTDPDFLGFMAKNSFEHIRGDGFRLNIG